MELISSMPVISLTVNGNPVTAEVEPRWLLSRLLRDHLGLTGTHVGCDTSQCGACVIHVDGKPVKSCSMLAAQADGVEITTIEGLAPKGKLHPMQEAFRDNHALQCGFCTPGMVMMSVALAEDQPDLDEEAVCKGLEGNLCRCTGYQNIIQAVMAGAKAMRS
jgi:carbon-monoxide dehydrogenase small subunit